MAANGYRLGEDWALEFQLLGLARLAKLVPGQITTADSYSTADWPNSSAQFLPSRCCAFVYFVTSSTNFSTNVFIWLSK